MFKGLKNKYGKYFRVAGFILSLLTLIFVISEHYGIWNNIRCTNKLLDYNSKIQTSYAEVVRTITPDSPEWECVINLIYEYSSVNFPSDKNPSGIARFVATQSYKQDIGVKYIAEWTAPSTPLAVLYKPWPGNVLGADDFIVAGSIGEFENWIEKDKSDFSFKAQNVFLGVLSIAVAFILI